MIRTIVKRITIFDINYKPIKKDNFIIKKDYSNLKLFECNQLYNFL